MASFAGPGVPRDQEKTASSGSRDMSSCSAIIVHPTHEHGLLSSIVPTLASHREVVLPFLPGGPRICKIQQGRQAENVGQLLWRSGVALANWIGKKASEDTGLFAGKSVLELGCGCAPLASIVAAEWGATQVVASDGDAEVIELSRENVQKNTLTLSKSIVCEQLEWGHSEGMKNLAKRYTSKGTFDIILAADVIYRAGAHNSLIRTLTEMSSAATVFYLAFQKRLHDFEGTFFSELLPRAGFQLEEVWAGDGGSGWNNLSIVKMIRPQSNNSNKMRANLKGKDQPEQFRSKVSSKRQMNQEKKNNRKSKKKMQEKSASRHRLRSDALQELVRTLSKEGEEAVQRKVVQFRSSGPSINLVKEIKDSIVCFNSALSSSERQLVHSAASTHRLFHWSVGTGDSRRVCISRVVKGSPQEDSLSARKNSRTRLKPTAGPGGSTTYNALPKPQRLFRKNKPSDLLKNKGSIVKHHPHKSKVDSLINSAADTAARLRRRIRDFGCTIASTRRQQNVQAHWIDSLSGLKDLSSAIQGAKCLAVDLEMHNVRSYNGFTCLLQFSLEDGSNYLVDAIALWDHIGDILGHHFADPTICKVFHSCEGGDIAALHRDFQIFCVNIFDTQHAARLLGLPLGLGLLLTEVMPSVSVLDKDRSTTMSDWRMRPLTDKQLAYACLDTKHLLALRMLLIGRLSGIELEPDGASDESVAMLQAASQFGSSTASSRPLTRLEAQLNDDDGFFSSEDEGSVRKEKSSSSDIDKVAFEASSQMRKSFLSSAAPEFVPASLVQPEERHGGANRSRNGDDIEADSLRHSLVLSQKSSLKLFKPRKPCRQRALKKLKKISRRRKLPAAKRDLFVDLFEWRDKTARDEDESAEYVCPEGAFMSICRFVPVSMIELQKTWSPLPALLTGQRKRVTETLFEITRAWKKAHSG